MTSENIILYINDRKWIDGLETGWNRIGGSPPNLDFFRQLKDHLFGECTVEFYVGDQRVLCSIILNDTEFRVKTNFVPFNITEFIKKEKDRVIKEKEEANFSERLEEVYFIQAKTLLNSTGRFPLFDRTKLVRDPEGQKCFVSHRWLTPAHPDPEGKHLSLLKSHAEMNQEAFYWIDYSCLPQPRRIFQTPVSRFRRILNTLLNKGRTTDLTVTSEDDTLFQSTLPKIASIQSKCSTVVIMDGDYEERLWCFVEHYFGVLFSQTNFSGQNRNIKYLSKSPQNPRSLIEKVQILEEPEWDKLKVTYPSDIPSIKFNYIWMSNIVRFQLYDRYSELRQSLPGHSVYSGRHYFQSAFGLEYSDTLTRLRSLFIEYGGDSRYFYNQGSLLWLAERFSWSIYPDDYKMEDFRFSKFLIFSEEMVGWIALLLGIIKILNKDNDKFVNLREIYTKIILMSLYR